MGIIICLIFFEGACTDLVTIYTNINYKKPSIEDLKSKYFLEKNGYDSIASLSFQILDKYGLNKGIQLNIYHDTIEWGRESGEYTTFDSLENIAKTNIFTQG